MEESPQPSQPPQCPINFEILAKTLIQQSPDKFKQIKEIRVPNLMKTDRCGTGSQLWQVEVHYNDGKIRFAVLKIAPKNDKGYLDIDNDYNGYCQMQKDWLADYLPKYSEKLPQTHGLITNDKFGSIMFISYAHSSDTEIKTLEKSLKKNLQDSLKILEKIVSTYLENSPKKSINLKAYEHFRSIFRKDLIEKIETFDWEKFGIDVDQTRVSIGNSIYPNILYFFKDLSKWESTIFSLPYGLLHGDLNLDNILVLPKKDFVFIDFEKVRTTIQYYDLAFILMWIAQKFALEDSNNFEDLIKLAQNIAECLKNGKGKTISKENSCFTTFIDIANRILTPFIKLCKKEGRKNQKVLVDEKKLPPEIARKGIQLTLATAALVRSYYELKDSKEVQKGFSHYCNGIFFYSFACFILNDTSIINFSSDGPSFSLPVTMDSLKRSFDFRENPSKQANLQLTSLEQSPNAKQSTVSYLGQKEPFAISIANSSNQNSSFFTKLIYEIPFPNNWIGNSLPGWNRFTQIDSFRYFSRIDIKTNQDFQEETSEVFFWQPSDNILLPCVFLLDLQILGGKALPFLVFNKNKRPIYITLEKIDIVPIKNGKAFLGVELVGNNCIVKEYLQWVSQRLFGKIRIDVQGNQKFSNIKPTISGIIKAISQAIAGQREIKIEEMGYNHDEESPKIFQYLLISSEEMWLDQQNKFPPSLQKAWELLATFSRPKPEYPKGSTDTILSWELPDSKKAKYALHKYGATILAHSSDEFNRNTKPRIFKEAHYLQWILAQELRNNPEKCLKLATMYKEETRQRFLKKCCEFFQK